VTLHARPPADPDGAENFLDTLFVAHGQRLLRFAVKALDDWQQRGGRGYEMNADVLVLAIHARATRTYEAIVKHLATRGFAEQGLMLTRSLFEDLVDAHWVVLNPELALTRINQHDRYCADQRERVQRRFPDYHQRDARDDDALLPSGECKQLARLFAGGSWTGLALDARVEKILPYWENPDDRRQIEWIYAWIAKAASETLHPSARSLNASIATADGDEAPFQFRLGATTEHTQPTILFAFWCYHLLLTLIIDRFDLGCADELMSEIVEPAVRDMQLQTV
jgi:hypothetical protein